MNTTPSEFSALKHTLSKSELLITAAMSGKTDIVSDIISSHREEIPTETQELAADLARLGGWKETEKALK